MYFSTLEEAERKIEEMEKEGKILHPANKGIFIVGYGFKCSNCGYLVDSFDEWKEIAKLVPYVESLSLSTSPFTIVEQHICPNCSLDQDWKLEELK